MPRESSLGRRAVRYKLPQNKDTPSRELGGWVELKPGLDRVLACLSYLLSRLRRDGHRARHGGAMDPAKVGKGAGCAEGELKALTGI